MRRMIYEATSRSKKRFKMYKAKKHWVVAPILFLVVLGVVGLVTDNVQAAELDTQPGTTMVQPGNPDLQQEKKHLRWQYLKKHYKKTLLLNRPR